MKKLVCAFTGPSNSGKTTLIEKIASILTPEYKVCIIKHDPKDKSVFDTPGKDSAKFFATGANVAVVSPEKTVFQFHENYEHDLDSLMSKLGNFDYLFVEGLKTWKLPRIGIFRNEIPVEYISFIDVLAIDGTIQKHSIPANLAVLDLNNPNEVIRWIDTHAKRIQTRGKDASTHLRRYQRMCNHDRRHHW